MQRGTAWQPLRAAASQIAHRSSSVNLAMDTLPKDIHTVIQDFCGTRELGYGLGCSGKAWRPSDTTWKRHASRHPLTRLAVKYVSSDYARWCASLYTVQRPTATARALTYSWDDEVRCSSVDPAPHYVLRIWRGGALVAVEMMEDNQSLQADVFVVKTPFSVIEGVALLPGQSLRIDIVALPSVGQDFVPTLIYSAFITSRGVDDQIALVRGRVEQEEPDDPFRKVQLLPRMASPLFESDDANCFTQIVPSVLAGDAHDQSDWHPNINPGPNCYARIVRDTNGEMTGLHINEFWWHFPAPYQQSIRLNRRG